MHFVQNLRKNSQRSLRKQNPIYSTPNAKSLMYLRGEELAEEILADSFFADQGSKTGVVYSTNLSG